MRVGGQRLLEPVPFEIADVACTLHRWVPEGCDLAGGLLRVAGHYPPGAAGADAARLVRWRLEQAMDMPRRLRIDGLVVDCRDLDYQWGDDLAVEPARIPDGFPVLVVLRPVQLAAFDEILQRPDRARQDLDEALAELESSLREIEGQRAKRPGALRRRPGEAVEAWLERLEGAHAERDASGSVTAVALTDTGIDDSALGHFAELDDLTRLEIAEPRVTARGVARIAALSHLRDLSLTLEVPDVGLAGIAEADRIRSLRVGGRSFTGIGLEQLARLSGLETLGLDGTGIADAALAPIPALVHLRALTLGQTGVTGAGLEGIGGLSRLETLHLHQTRLDDDGLAHLAHLPSIRTLLVPDTGITNAGVEHLAGLGSLEEVDLRRTGVDETGARRLQERLPRCRVLC